LALLLGNAVFVVATLITLVFGGGGLVIFIGGAGLVIFNVGVTWIMWFVMDDY
jgi:hypothetical protein